MPHMRLVFMEFLLVFERDGVIFSCTNRRWVRPAP
jgi:hypothetical protein